MTARARDGADRSTPTEDEVFAVIRDAIVTVLEVEPGGVRRETALVDDLRVDSLALVEMVELVEERLRPLTGGRFHIDDDDLDTLVTVGDTVDYALARL
ncbi:MAG TPA: phosphopantetheine-binding protein [Frankiaceae bacterium]|nr:phosphopantetheine-binding protein [Frankiaceae bacterium]